MSERFAIYFAPAQDSVLWMRAATWLGRDAASNTQVTQHIPIGMDAALFAQLTASPRRYGFHATLKAPMRLATGATQDDLLAAAKKFAANKAPVDMGHLKVQNLSGFIALIPSPQTAGTAQLAAECVAHFEPLRALMSAEEREKRLQAGLSTRQAELLDQYGYPYVMEEFRFHMTLTERLNERHHGQCMDAAKTWFAETLVEPISLDRIAVYKEPTPGAPFSRVADFPLGG